VYKLLLNNLYGKTIQKPIEKDIRFIKGAKAALKYAVKNYMKIISWQKVNGSGRSPSWTKSLSNDLYLFEIHKSTADFFNNCLIGSHILAMSKRIMNEVMCLAEELGLRMYYQDTDSFFY
jgi:DNA polymerase elongation subunit (family B)